MKTDLKTLLTDLEMTNAEAVTRWRAYFATRGESDLFDKLLDGDIVEVPFNLDDARKVITNSSLTVSGDARKFIMASLDPVNIGKTSEQLCTELGINYFKIMDESCTPAYIDYVSSIRESDIDMLVYNLRKTVLSDLQKLIRTSPAAGLALLKEMADNDKLAITLGISTSPKALGSGSMDVECSENEFNEPVPPVIDGEFTVKED